MNNKNQKTSLLEGIVNSNFLLLNKKQNKNLRSLKYSSNPCFGEITLNVHETLKSVKQFIRVLQFLKHKKNLFLHILMNNKQYSDLIASFFKDKTPNILIKSFLSKTNVSKKVLPYLIMLSNPLNNDKKIFKSIKEKNILLISKINSRLEKTNWGTYKIYNDLNDFKKIVFLLVIVDLIFKKKLNYEI